MFRIINVEPLAMAEKQFLFLPRDTKILAVKETFDNKIALVTERNVVPGGECETLEILLLAPNNECDLEGWMYLGVIDIDCVAYTRWLER